MLFKVAAEKRRETEEEKKWMKKIMRNPIEYSAAHWCHDTDIFTIVMTLYGLVRFGVAMLSSTLQLLKIKYPNVCRFLNTFQQHFNTIHSTDQFEGVLYKTHIQIRTPIKCQRLIFMWKN